MISEWKTIDSAPKDGSEILAVWSKLQEPTYAVIWWEDGEWHEYEIEVVVDGMSHWAVLNPPEGV